MFFFSQRCWPYGQHSSLLSATLTPLITRSTTTFSNNGRNGSTAAVSSTANIKSLKQNSSLSTSSSSCLSLPISKIEFSTNHHNLGSGSRQNGNMEFRQFNHGPQNGLQGQNNVSSSMQPSKDIIVHHHAGDIDSLGGILFMISPCVIMHKRIIFI